MNWLDIVLCVGLGFNLGALTTHLIRDHARHEETMRRLRAVRERRYDH